MSPSGLAVFIRDHAEEIITEWENFARTLIPAASNMSPLTLRDHIGEILVFIEKDIASHQTAAEQKKKSRGKGPVQLKISAAQTHAALRLAGGFDIDQMVSEYRALRASIVNLWCADKPQLVAKDLLDLTRFNESIDQILAESVSHYTLKVSQSKDLFIGILSHDLRTPLHVITMSAELQANIGTMDEKQRMLSQQILESTARITKIVGDLLDVTRARFGSGIPVIRESMNMEFVTRQIMSEMRVAYPDSTITLTCAGDMKGEWDKARIGQVLCNLIGNAIQYSFAQTPIELRLDGSPSGMTLTIHNVGTPIAPEKIPMLFDSFVRGIDDNGECKTSVSGNLGLGLFITRDIVQSHGGTIAVSSSEDEGTNFTVYLPCESSDALAKEVGKAK
ncbi:MAG: sensor histidine kinase [Rickettsiales bacterium]|nr:sensor histidine kinase [Rickettsiales bacterium]